MSRPALSFDQVRSRLEGARTKREFDAVVQDYRRQGAVTAEERVALEALAEKLVLRFCSAEEIARGIRGIAGRVRWSFRRPL